MRIRTAVLISGRGSNLKSLIAACAAPDFPAGIALVLSNVPDAPGLNHARAAGIAEQIIPHTEFQQRDDFDSALDTALLEGRIELVCLAGFMRILGGRFIAKWQGRLINIHPSLLPSFKGTHVHERAIESGVRISGCTVHYVTPEMNSGPAIAQAAVPVRANDTADSLGARVLEAEHRIYPLALKMVTQRKVWLENGKTVFSEYDFPAEFLINPAEN